MAHIISRAPSADRRCATWCSSHKSQSVLFIHKPQQFHKVPLRLFIGNRNNRSLGIPNLPLGQSRDSLERARRVRSTRDAKHKDHGVIIHGGSDGVLLTVSDGSATKVAGNVLTGSDTDTTAPDFCYILSYGQQRLGFYKYEEGKALSAHKAYLTFQHSSGVRAKALRMVFVDEEVDGIESISSDSANSPIGIYSVSGVRLNNLQKGINIVNGKKIVVK